MDNEVSKFYANKKFYLIQVLGMFIMGALVVYMALRFWNIMTRQALIIRGGDPVTGLVVGVLTIYCAITTVRYIFMNKPIIVINDKEIIYDMPNYGLLTIKKGQIRNIEIQEKPNWRGKNIRFLVINLESYVDGSKLHFKKLYKINYALFGRFKGSGLMGKSEVCINEKELKVPLENLYESIIELMNK